jgi:ribosome-associated protein
MLLIVARQHRTQERNRAAAMDALVQLVQRAAVVPKRRRATRPTNASRLRRLDDKAHRGRTKRDRAGPGADR